MKYLLSLIVFCRSMMVMAQMPLGLADAIKIGLDNNYQIQIANQQLEIAKNNNNLAAAGAYPSIAGNLNSNNSFFINNSPSPLNNGKQVASLGLTPSIDLSWVLFDNHKVKINKQRFEQLEAQSSGNSDLVVENTIHAIVLAYYRAVIEQEKIEVFEQVLELSKDRYNYEINSRELGTGSTFNVVQVKDAYLVDSTNVLRQQTLFDAAIRNLNTAMGEEEWRKTYILTDTIEFEPQVYTFETLQDKMFQNNRTLRNQLLNQQLLQTNTKFQESNTWKVPRVTMSTGISEDLSYANDFTPDIGFADFSGSGAQFNYYLRFGVSFNLFDAGASKRAIQNAIMEERIGNLNIADQQRTLSNQLANQLQTYQDQLQFIQLNEEQTRNAAQNLEISETRYRSGVINSFDFRTVQLAYLRAALAKLESIYTLKTIETELTRLTGGIVTNGN